MRTPNRKPGKFAFIKLDPHLTPAKFNELKVHLDHLKKVTLPRAVQEAKSLAEMGDFSENFGYSIAKGNLRRINARILALEEQLNHAVIIKPNKQKIVGLGSKITVSINGERQTFQILGSSETNPDQGIISHNSPLGSALMGRSEGESVKILHLGNDIVCTIIKIE
ncbi:MAG: hypothetical protein A2445_01550 [Candidatus Jacksonbacteria bacterium RIFOXYC2_FULL_44_29]|nr:MAG: Elongation factor GreA [Parcubacteria group bacterium GW2011_GWA2_36_10]KKT54116.1 MAG: Elongation factor GreA [Parcubacteria group bacterium GW2011_GWC2_44_22]OGY75405.1 MAG: hypothetical protein A2295_06030 [Candidatus Jacksonbacteria bacterium RIFOXYB2_FULL_44_15]OGY76942.1 MAG: hypothetical protein A2240_01935 [Candidatus Jacksonbacteria bacterium RIFOXYA2_FULL_43_12]OGY77475.1 MAG: hypothetical protein A2445_01550 [Candidatus Jacksonbacteria bacterium RIFOXYC2_FULL_44_29]OGY79850.